jgi:sulfoxide reductase catalytic subunit YedY
VVTRRAVGKCLLGGLLTGNLLLDRVWAAGRKIVGKGTRRESLIHENPAALDATQLEITSLGSFGTMGSTDVEVDLSTWRLEVVGRVNQPLKLTYSDLLALPALERTVLLICPGFFANQGRWRGVSLAALLRAADCHRAAGRVSVEGERGRQASFSMADVLSEKVFLAYQVNGTALPQKHGSPLRVVAEGYYGSEWIKYVNRISAEA